MPIGKNSIKRVANNGYANLESRAPDMENSVVELPKAEPEKKRELSKKSAPVAKKTAEKKPQKAQEAVKEQSTAKIEEAKPSIVDEANEATYVTVGEDMPVYLL